MKGRKERKGQGKGPSLPLPSLPARIASVKMTIMKIFK